MKILQFFPGRLVEAFKKYMNVDSSSPKGQALLAMHFIAQFAPDIRCKIQKATAGPQATMNDLLQLAYSLFKNRYMAEKAEHTQRDEQRTQMMAVALTTRRPLKGRLGFQGKFWPW